MLGARPDLPTATIEGLIVGPARRSDPGDGDRDPQPATGDEREIPPTTSLTFMHLGELVEYGTSRQVFDNPHQERTKEYVSGAFG